MTFPTFTVGPPVITGKDGFDQWLNLFWKWVKAWTTANTISAGAGIILTQTANGIVISADPEVTAADFAQFIENQKTMNELLFRIYLTMREQQEIPLEE